MVDLFQPSHALARRTWLALAASRGLAVETHLHPLPGPQGEPLAIDVVRDGPADARAVLLVSSACHGVEGYCGSGVQVAASEGSASKSDFAGFGGIFGGVRGPGLARQLRLTAAQAARHCQSSDAGFVLSAQGRHPCAAPAGRDGATFGAGSHPYRAAR